MSLQFNLLPDVKLEFDRQQRAKRFVFTVAALASAIAITLFIVSFFSVNVLQKKLLNDANNDINKYSKQLKSIPDLDKILTIQNQLNSLPNLHSSKHFTSRLFAYLPQITPTKVNIGKITLDTTANTISIEGSADTVESVNRFVDTMKFTSYTVGDDQSTKTKAFSSVLLTKVNRDDKNATYTIDAIFDPALFMGNKEVKLIVPQEVTTRSVINAPSTDSPLFNGQLETNTNQKGTQ